MKVLMVSGNYLCVRAGKIADAIPRIHDGLCRGYPPQFDEAYGTLTVIRNGSRSDLGEAIAASEADIIHVHNTPDWPVSIAKAYTDKPVILNVHDVFSAGVGGGTFDPDEEAAYADADAFVFCSEHQREFAKGLGFQVEGKPYIVLGNYASAILDKPHLPHIGGVCYAGSITGAGGYYDFTALAECLHIYPGGPMPKGYESATVHPTVMEYNLLAERLAQHDWGFLGVPEPQPGWLHAVPNKFAEYIAAGVPAIVLNAPMLKPFCDEGLGVYCTSVAEAKRATKMDPKPYRKRVLAQRHRFTMSYNVGPLQDLYARLKGESC